MNAKEYLQRAWRIDRRIERLIAERDALHERLTSGVKNVDGMPRGGKGDWTDSVLAVADMTNDIDARIKELCRVKAEVRAAIDAVEDMRQREVLEWRYLNYLSWEQIAQAMHYDVRWVYMLHRHGLKRVKEFIEIQC